MIIKEKKIIFYKYFDLFFIFIYLFTFGVGFKQKMYFLGWMS